MVVPGSDDIFRSLHGSLHTFSLPEDHSVRLLAKNLGKQIPERIVRKEIVALDFRVHGVMQPRSGRRDQKAAKDRPPTPHFVVWVARKPEVQKVRSLSELCGLRVTEEIYVASKAPLQCKRYQLFGHTQRNCGYTPWCVACGESQPSGECSAPSHQLKCCSSGESTKRTTGAVLSETRRRPRLSSRRQLRATSPTFQPASQFHRKRPSLCI